MRKKQLLILSLFLTFQISCFGAKYLKSILPYHILSDSINNEVPRDFCLVKGHVSTSYMQIFTETFVANENLTVKSFLQEKGYYEILIPATDSILIFFSNVCGKITISPYDFKSKHEVTINFQPEPIHRTIEVCKPVIYLYTKDALQVNLKLNFKGDLKFTYPLYNNGWNVIVSEKKGIQELTSKKQYPYLFWDGEMEDLTYKIENGKIMEGFVIETDTVISFFETQLTALGLNQTEQSDFITFWGPRLQQDKHALVQFLIDDAYATEIAELNVIPKPDQIKRIYLLYTPINQTSTYNLKPQSFKGFRRNGFTIVEWGGSKIKINQNSL